MLECSTHTEVVRVGAPVTLGNVTLLPVERVVLHSNRGDGHLWFSAAMEPYALIVRDADGIRVIATDAAAVSLRELRQRVPGIDMALAVV